MPHRTHQSVSDRRGSAWLADDEKSRRASNDGIGGALRARCRRAGTM